MAIGIENRPNKSSDCRKTAAAEIGPLSLRFGPSGPRAYPARVATRLLLSGYSAYHTQIALCGQRSRPRNGAPGRRTRPPVGLIAMSGGRLRRPAPSANKAFWRRGLQIGIGRPSDKPPDYGGPPPPRSGHWLFDWACRVSGHTPPGLQFSAGSHPRLIVFRFSAGHTQIVRVSIGGNPGGVYLVGVQTSFLEPNFQLRASGSWKLEVGLEDAIFSSPGNYLGEACGISPATPKSAFPLFFGESSFPLS